MAKIHTLRIANYRSIQTFEYVFGMTDCVCLIGRGDSGKSTILDAIAAVLSPNWNVSFQDTDFHNADISKPIEIEATLYDVPKVLLQETRYGLYIRGLDKATNIIHDDIKNEHEPVLTIRLTVERDLEPRWAVVTGRAGHEALEIKANDRARLNVFLVSDYIDRHFSWSKGNPLYALLRKNDAVEEDMSVIIDALRDAKQRIDENAFAHLNEVVETIKDGAATLGVDIANTLTTIDFRDISIKDGRICLHDGKVPFRQKGKGSKRLISMAIQLALAKSGGILMIDEIEQGLEPDKAQHLASILKSQQGGQLFITSHSRDVVVELDASNIYRMKRDAGTLFRFDPSMQGCIRKNPEALFCVSVLICEGATEVGICRSINEERIKQGKPSATFLGVRFADGQGTNSVAYAQGFIKAGYRVSLFCDSDVVDVNKEKEALRQAGATIIDCDANNSLEGQLFKDLPWPAIMELIEYRVTVMSVYWCKNK